MEKLQKIRLLDLSVVLSIAFLPAIIKSMSLLAGGPMKYYSDQLDLIFFVGAIEHALGILLLWHVYRLTRDVLALIT